MFSIQSEQWRSLRLAFVPFAVLMSLASLDTYGLELQREYRSSRTLGQGGTGIATARGVDAIFYNPAGIAEPTAEKDETTFDLYAFTPQVEATKNITTLTSNLSGDSAFTFLSNHQNEVFSGAFQNVIGFTGENIGFALLERLNTNIYVTPSPTSGVPQTNLYASNRAGAYISWADSYLDKTLFIGVGGKFLQKREVNLSLPLNDLDTLLTGNTMQDVFKKNINQGNGVGFDIGGKYLINIDKDFQTQFGAVYRNIGMSYRWGVGSSNLPIVEPQVLDIGVAASYRVEDDHLFKIAFDLRDVFNFQHTFLANRTHFGAEYSFYNMLGLMGGFNQGYPTWGAFVRFKYFKLEGGVYSEEIGKSLNDYETKRMYARLSLGKFI